MSYCLWLIATLRVVVLGTVVVSVMVSQQMVAAQNLGAPELPPGAVRLVSHARHGSRVAICAEEPGPPIEQGAALIPRTRVWVHDGDKMRQVGTAPGTCDSAWSPNGEQIAVVAPNGLWVFSADLRETTHLVDTRHSDAPSNEEIHRTLSGPQWAPDASCLAFVVSTGATSWVETVDARTGRIVHTSDPETYEFAWGADSRTILFGSRVVRLP